MVASVELSCWGKTQQLSHSNGQYASLANDTTRLAFFKSNRDQTLGPMLVCNGGLGDNG